MASTGPYRAERLPNGNTLIATRKQILEVDRTGKEVFTYNRTIADIMSAFKARDGQYVVVSNQGTDRRIDAAGKEVKAFTYEGVSNFGNELSAQRPCAGPAGVAKQSHGIRRRRQGVWEANVMQPMAVCRLPNGNTLIASQHWPAKMFEIDRAGKQVAETTLQSYVTRIRRR